MADRGLLMSGPMVRACLSGAKTHTRRTSDYWARATVGDGLWIREAWAVAGDCGVFPPPIERRIYRADYPGCVHPALQNVPPIKDIRWTPGIHMPRAVCRLEYRLGSIRQEPIQEITEAGAVAEGMLTVTVDDLVELAKGSKRRVVDVAAGVFETYIGEVGYLAHVWHGVSARDRFRLVFELLNGFEAWERNGLVWVLGMEANR